MVIEDYWVLARIDGEAVTFKKKMAKNFTKMAKNQYFFEVTPIFFHVFSIFFCKNRLFVVKPISATYLTVLPPFLMVFFSKQTEEI